MTRHHLAPTAFTRGDERWAASPDLHGIVSSIPTRRFRSSKLARVIGMVGGCAALVGGIVFMVVKNV